MSNAILKLSWTFFILLIFIKTFAQEEYKRQKSFALGYGFFSSARFNGQVWGDKPDYKHSATGPFYLKYVNRVTPRLSWGINLSFAQYNYSFNELVYVSGGGYQPQTALKRFKLKYDTYSVLGRLNFHFSEAEKLKLYAGFGIGYRIGVYTYGDPDYYYYGDKAGIFNTNELRALFPLGIEATMGARYKLSNKVELYSELGAAKSVWQGGLVVNI